MFPARLRPIASSMMRRSSVVGLRFQSQTAALPSTHQNGVLMAVAGLLLTGGVAYGIPKSSTEIIGVGGTPIKEPATGILFPKMVNGFYFAGCGVRVKYMFVQVYAVASYFDPLAMSAVKTNATALEDALVNPTYPRVIKIVMNRNLSADKMTSALIEALEPRMKGKDLEKLEEFKKMNPPIDLVKGAEIEMTIRGDTFLYKNAVGGMGTIHSEAFCHAMCDTFYGLDPVSPPHKQSVLEGIPKL